MSMLDIVPRSLAAKKNQPDPCELTQPSPPAPSRNGHPRSLFFGIDRLSFETPLAVKPNVWESRP